MNVTKYKRRCNPDGRKLSSGLIMALGLMEEAGKKDSCRTDTDRHSTEVAIRTYISRKNVLYGVHRKLQMASCRRWTLRQTCSYFCMSYLPILSDWLKIRASRKLLASYNLEVYKRRVETKCLLWKVRKTAQN